MKTELPAKHFSYTQSDFDAWLNSFTQWWPHMKDPAVWGRFQRQAASGRYQFSHVNQPRRHFAETLVAADFENRGYICWTAACILRRPNRGFHGYRRKQTDEAELKLISTLGVIPQIEYEKQYFQAGIRLKNMDVVGFHPATSHWIFTEVKKDSDRLHPSQVNGLLFIRRLFNLNQADVFISYVTKEQ